MIITYFRAVGDFPTEFYDNQQSELDKIEAQLENVNSEEGVNLQETLTVLKEAKAKLKETEVKGNVTIWFREVSQTKPKSISHNLSTVKYETYLTTHPDTEMCSILLGVPTERHRKKVVDKMYKLMKTLPSVTFDLSAKRSTRKQSMASKEKYSKSKISLDTAKLHIDWYKFFCGKYTHTFVFLDTHFHYIGNM